MDEQRRKNRARIVEIWRAATGEAVDVDLVGSDRQWAFWEALLANSPTPGDQP